MDYIQLVLYHQNKLVKSQFGTTYSLGEVKTFGRHFLQQYYRRD